MRRRDFLKSSLVASSLSLLGSTRVLHGQTKPARKVELPLVVSTWAFGKPSNEAALRALNEGGSILDAVEQGLRLAEAQSADHSVGLGGHPNAAGVVQLDAAIMSGVGHRAGAVAALEGIRHPISAARKVMEKSPHVMLVGEGARAFALAEGLESVSVEPARPNDGRKSEPKKEASLVPVKFKDGHDTLTLLALSENRDMAAGCSTSGVAGKLPGRVGDAPIIGSGLYVDNEVGAAGATGLGENIMRYCASFMVVENMRRGMSPEEACLETIRRILRFEPKGEPLKINLVAINKDGQFGAAGTPTPFPFAVTTRASSSVLNSRSAA
jgi:N4-(beta-N-acetylglucosaminyl)-L-asparaginase